MKMRDPRVLTISGLLLTLAGAGNIFVAAKALSESNYLAAFLCGFAGLAFSWVGIRNYIESLKLKDQDDG